MTTDRNHKRSRVVTLLLPLLVFGVLAVIWCNAGPTGVPQRDYAFTKRVNAEIAAVAARSEDELLPALDLEWVFGSHGIHAGGIRPELDFYYALADRNLRKLDEKLSGYDTGTRCRRVEQLNQDAFDRLAANCDDEIGALDSPPQPLSAGEASRPQRGRKNAVCGTLLLAAKHCGVATLTKMLQASIDFSEEIPARLEGKAFATEWHRTEMSRRYLPDKNFQLNVLLYAASKDSTLTTRQQKELSALIERAVKADTIRIHEMHVCRWDASPNWFEMKFLHGDVSLIDQRRGTEVIKDCSWWTHSDTAKDELISSVRRVLISDNR